MKFETCAILFCACLIGSLHAMDDNVVSLEHREKEKKITITIAGKLFSEYLYGNKDKPILYPIIGPYGIGMTRNFPMQKRVAGEATDHPHHQSLFYNHGLVNGKNFWLISEKTRIKNNGILKAVVQDNAANIICENNWVDGDDIICTDTTLIQCGVCEKGRFIDYKVSLHASHGEVTFGDTKEGTMAIRMHPALRLQGEVAKGSSINSEGVQGKDMWGKAAKWVDYWAPIEGNVVGIAIFDHSKNPRHPTTWHARDYGLVAANPFGKKHFKQGDGAMTIQANETVTFAYRFYFHEGSNQEADIPARYEQWVNTYNYGPVER